MKIKFYLDRIFGNRALSLRRLLTGFAVGALIGFGISLLGVCNLLGYDDAFLIMGLVGMCSWQTQARACVAVAAGLVVITVGIVAYTPLVSALLPMVTRRDALQSAPAVVVLSSHVQQGQTLSAPAQERIMEGYSVLQRGLAPRLVLTDARVEYGSQVPIVREQMRMLGLDYPIEDAGGVDNTHDEACVVAKLAKQRGWSRVILVTHPWHSRRAAAVFEKAGLPVLCAPCAEGSFDVNALQGCSERLAAFRVWLHEIVGYKVYKWHGWVK